MRRGLATTAAAVALPLLAAGSAGAQTTLDDLSREIDALKRGQIEIQKQLAEISRQLQTTRRAAAPSGPDVEGKTFTLAANPVKGDPAARLTLIEFLDFQWGYCARHVRETVPQIDKEYISTGKLRYASLDLPLERIHPLAFKAAEATHCAQDQGKYWEMHERLFAQQRNLEPWSQHAEALGLDVAEFDACIESGKHADAVRADMAEAQKAGASGTPSFVLGMTDPDDPSQVEGLAFIRGAQPFTAFKAAIDRALEELDEGE